LDNWDLYVDEFGNIATLQDDDAIAQDCASAIKLFQGELYYDVNEGVPYWTQILGQDASVALMQAKFASAAETQPYVANAVCVISSVQNRLVTGTVTITTTSGNVTAVTL